MVVALLAAPRTIRAICRPTSSTLKRPPAVYQNTVQFMAPRIDSRNACRSQSARRGKSSMRLAKICSYSSR